MFLFAYTIYIYTLHKSLCTYNVYMNTHISTEKETEKEGRERERNTYRHVYPWHYLSIDPSIYPSSCRHIYIYIYKICSLIGVHMCIDLCTHGRFCSSWAHGADVG